jgi:hypothetical protein
MSSETTPTSELATNVWTKQDPFVRFDLGPFVLLDGPFRPKSISHAGWLSIHCSGQLGFEVHFLVLFIFGFSCCNYPIVLELDGTGHCIDRSTAPFARTF